jgi:transposase
MDAKVADYRAQRGLLIARTRGGAIREVLDGRFLVPSQSGPGSYYVDISSCACTCTCPDYASRNGERCKHVWCVLIHTRREIVVEDGTIVITEEQEHRVYEQHKMYRPALRNEKRDFIRYLSALCKLVPETRYVGTGRPKASLADVIYAGTLKAFTTFSTNRNDSDLHDAHEKGLCGSTPAPNTILETVRRPEVIAVLTSLIDLSALPLRAIEIDFAPDATGIATHRYLRWLDHKTGETKKLNMFVKLNMTIGVLTLAATSARVMPGEWHESKHLPVMVRETAKNFLMRSIAADPGYTSKANLHVVVDEARAVPYFKFASHHGNRSADPLWNDTYERFALAGPQWDDRYGMRAKAEAAFSSMKRVLLEHVRARTFNGQVAEVLMRVLAHNIRRLVHAAYLMNVKVDFTSAPTITSSPMVVQ